MSIKMVNELKPGDKIFDLDFLDVRRYEYLCVHPKNTRYHIIINAITKDPLKIYDEKLQSILDKDFKTYKDARLELANTLIKYANRIIEFGE